MEKLVSSLRQLQIQDQQRVLLELLQETSHEHQYNLLLPVVASTSGYVKWRLGAYISWKDQSDLLSLLPAELQEMVLTYLDGASLLTTCRVSKDWNRILRSHSQLWWKKCKQLGVNMEVVSGGEDWHRAYVSSLRQLTSLKNETAFVEKFMQLQNCNKAVKAVDYQNGYLCTVSEEDYVNIWQLDLNIPLVSFPAARAVSCIKFSPNFLLVCGHFVGTLTSWDLSEMSKHNGVVYEDVGGDAEEYQLLVSKFKMHAGPVFCCDFSKELDLLVSGGADDCINLWCLSSGLQVKCLPQQEHWVLRVILMVDDTATGQHCIIAMTRDSVSKLLWESNRQDNHANAGTNTVNMGTIDEIGKKMCVRLNEGNTNFFTPGLQYSNKYIGLIKQDIDEKQASLCIYEINNFNLRYNISLKFKVKKLLALGNRYALLLTVGCVLYSSTLLILDIVTGETIGKHTIPHSKMTTPDGAQLVVGDVDWLDGLRVDTSLAHKITHAQEELTTQTCSDTEPSSDESNQPSLHTKILKMIDQNSKAGKCLQKERPNRLVLAAGVQSEPGSLFTLWWTCSSDPAKCKEE